MDGNFKGNLQLPVKLYFQSRGHLGFITSYSSGIPHSPHSHQFLPPILPHPFGTTSPHEKQTTNCFLQNFSFINRFNKWFNVQENNLTSPEKLRNAIHPICQVTPAFAKQQDLSNTQSTSSQSSPAPALQVHVQDWSLKPTTNKQHKKCTGIQTWSRKKKRKKEKDNILPASKQSEESTSSPQTWASLSPWQQERLRGAGKEPSAHPSATSCFVNTQIYRQHIKAWLWRAPRALNSSHTQRASMWNTALIPRAGNYLVSNTNSQKPNKLLQENQHQPFPHNSPHLSAAQTSQPWVRTSKQKTF